jgi:transposase InsO family protein
VKYAFIAAQLDANAGYSVTFMCRLLQVRRQGFYDYRHGKTVGARTRQDATLTDAIREIMAEHRNRLGVRRVRRELARAGHRVSHKRVHRLMRAADLRCRHPRRYKVTTVRGAEGAGLVDLVNRDFSASAPGQKWVGDITYIDTRAGWAYLATVIDCYSRKVVGWAVATHLRTDLVTDALTNALATHPPRPAVIFHSDRGCQYTSHQFRTLCRKHNIRPSVGATGICFDNSVAESFFATLKKECFHGAVWRDAHAVRIAAFEFIEGYYNRRRPHSTIGYRTPQEYEAEFDEIRSNAA